MSDQELDSRLPREGAYWTTLAEQIDDRANPLLERRRRRGTGLSVWWARSDLSPALACAAVACAVAAWWLVPARPVVTEPTVVARALYPADPLAGRLLTAPSAPDLATLVSSGATASAARRED